MEEGGEEEMICIDFILYIVNILGPVPLVHIIL